MILTSLFHFRCIEIRQAIAKALFQKKEFYRKCDEEKHLNSEFKSDKYDKKSIKLRIN
jgi:hypothetical protein